MGPDLPGPAKSVGADVSVYLITEPMTCGFKGAPQ